MEIKTYGVYGLTEWHGKVKAGTLEANLSFVGGTSSPSGSQPAYMVTKDPITQFVIENSKEYKSGFIRLVMRQVLPGTHMRIATHKSIPDSDEQANEHLSEETKTETVKPAGDVETPTPETDIEPIEDERGLTEVEFSTNQEAKDYLTKTFGVKSGTMRTRAEIIAVGETYGVKITFVTE